MSIKDKSLEAAVLSIIRHKSTEWPNTGQYNTQDAKGTYLCRGCGLALFRADSKFSSSCGWPSFDVSIDQAVIEEPDTDGVRTEILCGRCAAHLGHVFDGEGLTEKNRRYCVNSLSLDFVDQLTVTDTEEAIVAGGCFWGIQYYFNRLSGVLKTEVGYTGGQQLSPSYTEVCRGTTGHFEATRVIYDPTLVSFEAVLKCFFEIHDPSQASGQGPDRGPQYRSAVFYYDDAQKQIALKLIDHLQKKGVAVATLLLPVSTFWAAEDSHQQYYEKVKQKPYCHVYTKRF